MQQIIHSYTDDKTFMGTVLVVKNGKALIDQGYGSADLEWSIPNSPDTRFRLGSITKQFTAASILLLAKRGKLNIDDPISKYLPDAPPAETKFFLKVVDAEIEFFRDSATQPSTASSSTRATSSMRGKSSKPDQVSTGKKFYNRSSQETSL
jgi:hypothetical protein